MRILPTALQLLWRGDIVFLIIIVSIFINVMMSGPSPNPEGSLFFRAVFPEKRSFHPKWGNQQHYITLTHSIRINGEVLELLYKDEALSETVPLNILCTYSLSKITWPIIYRHGCPAKSDLPCSRHYLSIFWLSNPKNNFQQGPCCLCNYSASLAIIYADPPNNLC